MDQRRIPLFFLVRRTVYFLFLLLLAGCTSRGQSPPETSVAAVAEENPLKAYVEKADSVFKFEPVRQIKSDGYTFHVLRMTSQEWLDSSLVEDPTWWHYVEIVIPDRASGNTGMLYIDGGTREDKIPDSPHPIPLQTALATQSITARVHNVPNQPIYFDNDNTGARYEDGIIAYGWRQFLEDGIKTKDTEWLSRLPMTKAAVRAMDAITVFTQSETGTAIEQFVVAGGSKRGWTTWTTAVTDERVVAIAPFVIDLLNLVPSFEHHWRTYGFWSPAVNDYVEEGIMEWQHSHEYRAMLDIVEPFSYHDQLTLPKLLINATGDEFFLPDSWRFYYPELEGEKHLRYVPNTGHSLSESDALQTFIAFYYGIVNDRPRPTFDWRVENDTIYISTSTDMPPSNITLWQAYNPEARDFRLPVLGKAYRASHIPLESDGKYQISVPVPDEGWRAFFVELTFGDFAPTPFKSTTGVVVIPDQYPYPPYVSEDPQGTKD